MASVQRRVHKEDTFTYAISFNGKVRFTLDFAADANKNDIEAEVLNHPDAQKWIEVKHPRR